MCEKYVCTQGNHKEYYNFKLCGDWMCNTTVDIITNMSEFDAFNYTMLHTLYIKLYILAWTTISQYHNNTFIVYYNTSDCVSYVLSSMAQKHIMGIWWC